MRKETQQEEFWKGDFAEGYVERNKGEDILAAKLTAFSYFLRHATAIHTSLELGGNIGMNERAMGLLIPGIQMHVVELNPEAAEICRTVKGVNNVYAGSIFDYETDMRYDLVFTCGVMIHLDPSMLDSVYEKMYRFSKKYILVSEYYNPEPIEVPYHGFSEKLYKRDFAGEMMDKYPDLRLIDYGFIYRRIMSFPVIRDLSWFLMEKA